MKTVKLTNDEVQALVDILDQEKENLVQTYYDKLITELQFQTSHYFLSNLRTKIDPE